MRYAELYLLTPPLKHTRTHTALLLVQTHTTQYTLYTSPSSEVNIIQLHIWLTRLSYTEAFKPITIMVFIQISDIILTICGTT